MNGSTGSEATQDDALGSADALTCVTKQSTNYHWFMRHTQALNRKSGCGTLLRSDVPEVLLASAAYRGAAPTNTKYPQRTTRPAKRAPRTRGRAFQPSDCESPAAAIMAHLSGSKLPYRDINVKVSNDAYTFTSPSSPDAPALILDRPTGDVRLSEGALNTSKRTSRVSSIAGILGIVQLRLGQ